MIRILAETRLDPDFPLSRRELRPLLVRSLAVIGLEEASMTLRLVGDAEIARLNQAFLGCHGPTNVLSFPAREDSGATEGADGDGNSEDDAALLGEIALSVDTLAREARLYGQDPCEHLVRLVVHAALHLAGIDHGPEMEAMTEAALDALSDEAAA